MMNEHLSNSELIKRIRSILEGAIRCQSEVVSKNLGILAGMPSKKPLVDEFIKLRTDLQKTTEKNIEHEDSPDENKKLYRQIVLACHSDRTSHLTTEEQNDRILIFQNATEAYEQNDKIGLLLQACSIPELADKFQIPEELIASLNEKALVELATAHSLQKMQLHEFVIMIEDALHLMRAQLLSKIKLPLVLELTEK